MFKDSPAPAALDARYVTEDVPYGLVPIAELGRNFAGEGRTLERMGLEGRALATIMGDL